MILPDNPGNQGEGKTPGGGSDLIPNLECSREPWLTLWDEIKPVGRPQGRSADPPAWKTGK